MQVHSGFIPGHSGSLRFTQVRSAFGFSTENVSTLKIQDCCNQVLNCDSFHCLLNREETIHGVSCNATRHSREHSVSRPAESPQIYRVQLHIRTGEGGSNGVGGQGGPPPSSYGVWPFYYFPAPCLVFRLEKIARDKLRHQHRYKGRHRSPMAPQGQGASHLTSASLPLSLHGFDMVVVCALPKRLHMGSLRPQIRLSTAPTAPRRNVRPRKIRGHGLRTLNRSYSRMSSSYLQAST